MKSISLIAALALGLLLTACGSAGPKTDLNVSMTDFSYTPNELLVPAGEEITLHLANNGAVVHNFIVMKAGTDVGADFDAADEPNVYWRLEAQPGESVTGSFVAPEEAGTYAVVCGTAGHFMAGMIGTLVVVSP
jgi:plastocyanin